MATTLQTQLTVRQREELLKRAKSLNLKSKEISLPAITPVARGASVPLSFAQQRLWFLAQMEGGSKAYHVPLALRLRGGLNGAALKQALDRMMTRHESLRTTLEMIEGEPQQRIAPVEDCRFHLLEHDLRKHENAQEELERLMEEEAGAAFDLEAGPLIRGRLIQLGEEEHALLITMHHIVSDGWSMGVLYRELSILYGAYARGEEDPLPKPEVQYADYAVWQRKWMEGEILQQQAEYWRKNLEGAPELLELPADHVRPAQQDHAGAALPVMLNAKLTAGLKDLSARQGTTLFMTLLAGWAVLLGRLSGRQDVVIGTPMANRGRMEIENLVGFFVNMLVMRTDISGSPTVVELLARVKKQSVAAQQHQDIPFEQVVEIVRPVRSLAHSPVFQVSFNWVDRFEDSPKFSGLETAPLQSSPHVVSKFDLALALHESGECITGGLEYATALFDSGTVERYREYFVRLLEGMVSHENVSVDRLPLLGESERRQLVYEQNQITGQVAGDCVHELFEQQVEKTPDGIAVEFEGRQMTYGELNRRANRLAHYLRGLGVRPDARVGICVERNLEMIAGVLAILKAGGAYVPLDPAYPAERLSFMLEDSSPVVLLTQGHLRGALPEVRESVAVVDMAESGLWQNEADTSPDRKDVGLNSGHPAYVIYTSGSTGQPKGVVVEHGNVGRLFSATQEWFQFDANDVWTLFHSYAFDFSVWEIWGALFYGGRLIVVPKDSARSAEDFYSLVCQNRVTILNQTPSAFRQFITAQAESRERHELRRVIFGGEALEVSSLRPWYEQNEGRKTQLVNMYGITETTVHVTYRPLQLSDSEKLGSPIGSRIPDLTSYILDGEGQPSPVGVAGELHIGGAGVARGYLNRPELTAQRFTPNPFGEAGERIYKTGDLGRWKADGEIEFVGRSDEQVKIRGFRIELGEVEASLREQAGVKEAVAIARIKTNGDRQLVGYVVAAKGANVTAAEVREGMAKKLPDYMVPMVVVIDELPLTTNGKLDRKKLPAPEETSGETEGAYAPPRNSTEKILAEVWAEALGLERVGIHGNFFELGGDSILSVRIIGRARKRGLEFSLQELFQRQTIAALAQVVRRAGNEEKVVTAPFELAGEEVQSRLPQNIEDAYPLSRLQAGLLFHSNYAPESGLYHVVIGWRVCLPYEAEKFRSAVDRLTHRHAMLRTSIDMANFAEPMQLVHRQVELQVAEQDWRLQSATEQEAGLVEFAEHEYRTGFAWEQAPLLRIFVHQLSDDAFQCSFSCHHAIMDGWSDASLITELVTDYERHLAGKTQEVELIEASYRDYIALERRALASADSIAFWKQMLEDHRATPVPLREDRGEEKSTKEILVRMLAMSESTRERLQQLARENETPLKTVLLAAHMKALQVLSGQSDVTTGVTLNGRPEVEGGEQVVGLFLNTLPFRLRLESDEWKSLIRETFAVEQRILPHRRYPMIDLRQQMGSESLFETTFNYVNFHVQNEPGRDNGNGRKLLERRGGYTRNSLNFLVNFEVLPEAGGLVGTLHSNTGIMNAATMERIAGYYERILAAVAEDRIADVRTEAERAQIESWNRTEAEVPRGCVHLLFEEQALRRPEAIAVVCGGEELSYAELNARANQLSHYLRGLGVRTEDRVAICVDRSLEMIVGMLGILKAGAAYVPMDPAYPVDRLKYMLENCEPAALLTQSHLQARFSGIHDAVCRVDLTADVSEWFHLPTANLNAIGVTPNHLAYVIYTSGSTGLPKGVGVEHQSLNNLIHWHMEAFGLHAGQSCSSVAGFGFDAATWEIWPALSAGARLLMPAPAESSDPERLLEWWCGQSLDVGFLSTPMAECGWQSGVSDAQVQTLLVGGDRLRRIPEALKFSLVNNYGPTETTVVATSAQVMPGAQTISIGRPIMNTRVHLLDGRGEAVPVGVTGELYIAGIQVARGYLQRPDLTGERFVPDPFAGNGSRMYKTGDLGRWLADGTIDFAGRNDDQVKVRGFRIELGEIETRLAQHRHVREAVVVARELADGETRLLAYFTVAGAGDEAEKGEISAEELREFLRQSLPEHMVPAAYVRLQRLPLTANGKVDRKALPLPEGDAFALRRYEEPQGEIEIAVAQIWSEVLQVEQVGRHDNFFELGGHSLLAMRAIARLRQSLAVEVGVDALFTRSVLSDFARVVEHARPSSLPAIGPAERGEWLPLSFAQQRLWFLTQMEGGSKAYHMPLGMRLQGRLDRAALKQALNQIVARHEALRTTFAMVEGVPQQRIAAVENSWFHLLEQDFRQYPDKDAQSELERVMAEEADAAFDMEAGPLIRGRLIQLSEEKHALLITMHHIVSDAWSMGIFFNELTTFYGASVRGEENPLTELAVQYADYAVWQRKWMEGEVLEQQAEYWRKNLKGAPELLEIPADRVRPLRQDHAGAALGVMLPERLTAGLRELSARHGTTLYMTLMAGWAVLLARLSGQQDVMIGTPVANRGRVEIENLIGFFVNTLVVRVDMSGSPTVGEMLARVKRQSIAAQQHQDIPFEQVVDLVQPVRSRAHSPLFQVLFAWQEVSNKSELPGLAVAPLSSEVHHVAKFDLTLALQESGERITGGVEYATALFDAETVQRYLHYFTRLLEGMVAGGEGAAVHGLGILSEAERRQIVGEWSRTASYPHAQAVANRQVYILDELKEPVPMGVVGEIYLGGSEAERDSLNQAEEMLEPMIPEAMIENPFAEEAEARMCRTGNLGRWIEAGTVEILGAKDDQVQVRGYRIEAEKIESLIQKHPSVGEAVVAAQDDPAGGKSLVAYYTLAKACEGTTISTEELRESLSQSLPEYMVPAAYVQLEKIPLKANGKVDRKALPAPEASAFAVRRYEAPVGEIETIVAEIWAQVLQAERVGRYDNFFELGGRSLLAVQVTARLRQALGAEVGVDSLFARPVLKDFAREVESARQSSLPAITRADRGVALPLSFAQQRLWVLSQMGEGSQAYNMPLGMLLHGRLERTALKQALDRIVVRHEALRTTFAMEEGQPRQRIVAAEKSCFSLIEHDLRQRQSGEAQGELARVIAEEAGAAFDLEAGPLIRGRLIQLGEEEHALLITMHHIVSDGWSMAVFFRELHTLYGAYVRGEEDPLPELMVQYADYALWQRKWMEGEILERQAEYWKKNLEGAPELLELPADRVRPAQQDHAGASLNIVLNERLTAGLKELSARKGTTLFMTLMAGWAVLLAKLSGQQDVVIGTPNANRGRMETESLIGFFVSTLAIRVDLSGRPTAGDMLERVKRQTIEAQQNQDIPFEYVVELVRPVRTLAHSPLFQVMFVWQDVVEGDPELPGLAIGPLPSSPQIVPKFDMTLQLQELGDQIVGGVEYASALFDAGTVERYMGYFTRLLEAMVRDENQAVAGLAIMAEEERTQLLEGWNQSERDYPWNKSLSELFEEQVVRTPDAVAVVYEGEELTYEELNGRANQLAHYLRGQGVGPEVRVGLLASRSEKFLIGVLAVLKAGGAYVPLDPDYSAERVREIVTRSEPRLILIGEEQAGLLDSNAVTLVGLEAGAYSGEARSNLNIRRDPNTLAYVIFTSGSTGVPKGVMVREGGMVNHLYIKIDDLGLCNSDVMAQTASQCFDISVWQFLSLLLVGGKVVVASSEITHDPAKLLAFLAGQKVSICEVVPSMLELMLQESLWKNGRNDLAALRWLLATGEALPPELGRRWVTEHPQIPLLNAYGPTECSDDVSQYRMPAVQESGMLYTPIGQPVGNMQLYILNEMLLPVPVGVAGELHIGGVGIGRGYLNDAATTADRFIPNPYGSEPGSRMYKTGDLGRWRRDGNAEFMGRNDHQVKIRGFRIELGEIELRLAKYPGVRAAVVLAREDRPGEKQLVAYYTGNEENDANTEAEQLRAHVAAKLPEYMVPAAYVRLEKLPLTANGKLDRKALPAPEFKPREWRAPRTPHEQILCALVAEIVGVDRVGLDDSFFALGGDSIKSTQLAHKARNLGLMLTPRDVFMYPTLGELAAALESHQGEELPDVMRDLSAEAVLDANIVPAFQTPAASPAENIFLTGASGFLGCFLLAELLNRTQANVYCLVRASTQEEGLARISRKLKSFDLWDDAMAARIVAVPGDISKPLLGLSVERFETMANVIDDIYHSAAMVNFVYSYDVLKPSNVFGTQEIIRMASLGRRKKLHHISTVSVIPPVFDSGDVEPVAEEAMRHGWRNLSFGYSQSKWVAERLVEIAGSRGIPATIYRPPSISGSTQTGAVNEDDILWQILIACLQLGAVPDTDSEENNGAGDDKMSVDFLGQINMMPVDYLGRAIVALSQHEEVLGRSINMVHDKPVNLRALFQGVLSWGESAGVPMQKIPFESWLSRCTASEELKEVGAFLTNATQKTMAQAKGARVKIEMDFESNRLLQEEGLKIPPITEELMQRYMEYLAGTMEKDRLVA